MTADELNLSDKDQENLSFQKYLKKIKRLLGLIEARIEIVEKYLMLEEFFIESRYR